MKFLDLIKSVFRLLHCDIAFHPSDPLLRRRMHLLRHYGITSILDVGANAGQYGLEMRDLGFEGKLISFEPQKDAFAVLAKNAKTDKKWMVLNYGLGNSDKSLEINISKNSYSSSILDILPSHIASSPESEYIGKETVAIWKLDSIFKQFFSANEIYLLKIDTQGFERQVLEGASHSLEHCAGIQMEMSLVSLYKGGALFYEMDAFLNSKGFYLCSVEPEFDDPATKRLLQINGFYFKLKAK